MLIVSLPPNDEQAERFTKSGIPTVLIDSDHPGLCRIIADDIQGGRIATQHLIDLGHRKIAFLSDFLETPFHPAMEFRFQGYRESLESAGIPFDPNYLVEGKIGRTSAKKMAKMLLTLKNPPTAVFASSDTHALGILDAAQEMGIKIPEDVSVIGYDNIRESSYNNLSTIDQHLYDSGVIGALMLLEVLGNQITLPYKQYVPLDLVKRNTTAPLS
jgi:DNA-binding LacI/PurR family transcriptional regulator